MGRGVSRGTGEGEIACVCVCDVHLAWWYKSCLFSLSSLFSFADYFLFERGWFGGLQDGSGDDDDGDEKEKEEEEE